MNWSLAAPYFAAAFAIGYLFGSIPFGLLLTRFAGLGDIRRLGSGNIGATNVLRTGRKGLAAATLVGDALKGTAAVLLIGWLWGPNAAILAGLGAFLGHLFPVWLGFKGGKGVATFVGCLLGLKPVAALAFGGDLARDGGGQPLLLAVRARRERRDAAGAVVARRASDGRAVRGPHAAPVVEAIARISGGSRPAARAGSARALARAHEPESPQRRAAPRLAAPDPLREHRAAHLHEPGQPLRRRCRGARGAAGTLSPDRPRGLEDHEPRRGRARDRGGDAPRRPLRSPPASPNTRRRCRRSIPRRL